MSTHNRDLLKNIRTFPSLIKYLHDELDWPIHSDDFEELTFDYTPDELGIDSKNAAKIQEIKRLRPLTASQPWGIFFVKFEPKKLPVVALRRILSRVVVKKRESANSAERAAWETDDLLFISNYGEGEERKISLAHFTQDRTKNDLPTLKVLGWDNLDTALHLDHVAEEFSTKLTWPDNENNIEDWRQSWRSAFTLGHREVITTSKKLSIELAGLARDIRNRINTVLAIETEEGPVTKLKAAFKEALIHNLDDDGFADMYAQTIAYGLLSARVTNSSGGTVDDVAVAMPVTNPFLKELMESFLDVGDRNGKAGQGPGLDFDELGVSEVVELLDTAKMEDVLRDFGDKNPQEDPVIHFYELFLKEYDAKKRMQRGVFYTPRPVVSFIVRSVDRLLRTEFGLVYGLADTATWCEMAERFDDIEIPEGVNPEQPFVQILDPATGTGTFLVEVIDIIHNTMIKKWKALGYGEQKIQALWNDYVPKHLLPRLHGYELLMAPYAIAHLKIGLKLYETDYRSGSNERVRVYLTNALEPASDKQLGLDFLPALAHEAQAVNEIKRKQLFTVVIGNPPYSNYGQLNRIPFILDLLIDYKRDLKEKKLNLDDDFIKFLRFSHWVLDESGVGILGFITNNTYFDGITHRQIRFSLRTSMAKILAVDLHGSSVKKEAAPDGTLDQNVFDIQQGVGISIWIKRQERNYFADVQHTDIWGVRQDKYDVLTGNSVLESDLRELCPDDPYHFFVPKNFSFREEYQQCIKLEAIFNIFGSGVQTDRDELFIDEMRETLLKRIETLYSEDGLREPFRSQYRVEDSSSYPLLQRIRSTEFDPTAIAKCLYRPFDKRRIYYSVGITSRPAWDVMQHMLGQRALGLLTMRQFEYNVPEACYFLVTDGIVERRVFVSNRGAASLFPLYLESSGQNYTLLPDGNSNELNIQSRFIHALAGAMAVLVVPENGLPKGVTGENIFSYIYSVMHSPTYRSRYAEFLKIEFPRIPLPGSFELFCNLSKLGGKLIALHLMTYPNLDEFITTYSGPRILEFGQAGWLDDTIWLDASKTCAREGHRATKPGTVGLRGVPEEVWDFHIGGYQICHKWLKDRKGHMVSEGDLIHYQKIIVAIAETIRIMKAIDKTIEEYGGWLNAFQLEETKKKTDDSSSGMLKAAEERTSYGKNRK